MSMNEPMDWQASMEATELAATAAAPRTERVVFGVAQIIEDQRQHLSLIKEIKKELQQLTVYMKEMDKPAHESMPVISDRPFFEWRTVVAALVAGTLFGVFIVS